jgi:phosphatidyl-myo-inositol dimannoside synthase
VSRPLRLLTLGHSYVVGGNRALARSLAEAGGDRWEVTCAAPERFPGDLGPVELRPEAGERVVPLGVHGARRIHTMLYGRGLGRLLADGWDVVHCWEEPFVASAAQVAAWTPPRSRLVFATFQNLPRRYPPPFRWTEGFAMRRAAGWIAFGRTVADALRDRPGYAVRPHRVIGPGIDTVRFTPDPDAGRRVRASLGWGGGGPPVVGFVGRFAPEKGFETLLRALDGANAPWRALIVGGGAGEPLLRRWAAGHGDRVRVVVGVEHRRVPDFLNAMDLLCAPSRTTPRWKEQFGRVLGEAMACAVPVVASDSGEIPHVLDGAGVLLPEDDAAAWRGQLESLLADPGRRQRLGERGRSRAEAELSLPVAARAHLRFFAELAG